MNSIMATRATKAREDSAWPMERTRQVPSLSAVSLAQNWRPGQKKGDKVHDRMRADEVRTERQTVGWCRWCSVGDLCHTRALRNRKAGECCGSTSIRERNDAEGVVADVAWAVFCANKRKHGAVRISELRGGYAASAVRETRRLRIATRLAAAAAHEGRWACRRSPSKAFVTKEQRESDNGIRKKAARGMSRPSSH